VRTASATEAAQLCFVQQSCISRSQQLDAVRYRRRRRSIDRRLLVSVLGLSLSETVTVAVAVLFFSKRDRVGTHSSRYSNYGSGWLKSEQSGFRFRVCRYRP